MKLFSKSLILGFFFLSLGFFSSVSANDCVKICDKFLSCTEQMNGRSATAAEKTKLNDNCAKTCAKKTAQIAGCFANNSGDCGTYASCIINLAKAPKK